MQPTVMKSSRFNFLICDEISRVMMDEIQRLERENTRLRQSTVGDLRIIRRDVRAIRKQNAKGNEH